MKKLSIYTACALLPTLLTVGCTSGAGTQKLTDYVDPLIGSGGHGHVFVGANVPFGLLQAGPTSVTQGWDWCSGYHESDSTVIGFSQTHLSGTGCGDLLDLNIMPVVGTDLTYDRGRVDSIGSGLWSHADRSKEIAKPGYYSVPLVRYDILAEMTATSRVGFYRFTFPESKESAIVLDLHEGGGYRPGDITMEKVSDTRIIGHRHSQGWANNQKLYFAIDFSKPFTKFERLGENNSYGRADFDTKAGEQILVKVAISPVSEEGALANLKSELPGWKFDKTAQKAEDLWNQELAKIQVKGGTEDQKKIFYTAMYHAMIAPSEFCDVNNDTRAANDSIVRGLPYKSYTTYSLWDTYRAEMPLLSIIQPERYAEMINSMADICDAQGRLPVWHLWGCETDCMVGNSGLPVVADAIVKDIPGVDKQRAYKALLTTAMNPGRGNGARMEYGYIPFDKHHESVAYDMEYALDDWAVAQAALCMGDTANYNYFLNRSKSYRNYFDPSVGFMRGKDSNGNWREPFNEFDTSHRANDYCEGNAWQYIWLAPHDVDGLVELFGSKEKMAEKLDSLFIIDSKLEGENVSADVSGLIGQYAHGNEPGHHTIFLYTMLGQPEKTSDLARYILDSMYSTERDGLSGNEDVGQMSAWYILTAMGLYEVEPGSGRYWFASPIFDEVDITVPGGTFRIVAENNSDDNKYIAGVTLNGQPYDKSYVTYADIMNGGELKFTMSGNHN